MDGVNLSIWWWGVLFLWVIFCLVYLFHRLKIPTLVGYLLAGSAIASLLGSGSEGFSQLAQTGLVVLLFTIGLETDFGFIKENRRLVIGGGTLQVVCTGGILSLVLMFFGFPLFHSLWIGQFLALSSTAVVSKLIQEKVEESKSTESLSMGILVWQDFLAIPAIILLSANFTDITLSTLFVQSILALSKTLFVIAGVYIVGTIFVPRVFSRLVSLPSEILNLAVILFIGIAVSTFSQIGISASVAAFLAGVLVGQTRESAHIFGQLRPIKDILTAIFFVYLGSTVPLGILAASLVTVVPFVLILIFLKIFITMFLLMRMKYHLRVSFSIGVMLSQVGEFAFILFFLAIKKGFLSEQQYIFLLSVVILSLLLSPILIRHRQGLYRKLRVLIRKYYPQLWMKMVGGISLSTEMNLQELENHIILCGFGRIGKYIGRALDMSKIPYVAIDFDKSRVASGVSGGANVIYGDPTDIHILDLVKVNKAALLIITLPGRKTVESILLHAISVNKNLKVIARVTAEGEQHRLRDLGADVVIQPEFEAALVIVKKVLSGYGIDKDEQSGKLKRLRIEHGMG